MKKLFLKLLIVLALVILTNTVAVFAVLPATVNGAEDYVPLAPIPGTYSAGSNTTNLNTYLAGLFKVAIAVAGVLAFFMIVWGGFTYMTTDSIGGKEEGKEYIQNALLGLTLALSAFLLLETINPKLVKFSLDFGAVERTTTNRPPFDLEGARVAGANQTSLAETLISSGRYRLGDYANARDSVAKIYDDEINKLRENGRIADSNLDKASALQTEKRVQIDYLDNLQNVQSTFASSINQNESYIRQGVQRLGDQSATIEINYRTRIAELERSGNDASARLAEQRYTQLTNEIELSVRELCAKMSLGLRAITPRCQN